MGKPTYRLPQTCCRPVRLGGSLIPRPSIAANSVEDLIKLLRRMTSGGRMVDIQLDVVRLEAVRLEAW